jgi:Outer membrane protein beta-barrel family
MKISFSTILLVIVLSMFQSSLFGQECSYSIKVMDATNNLLEAAIVEFSNVGGKVLEIGYTDSVGIYTTKKMNADSVFVNVTYLGFENIKKAFRCNNLNVETYTFNMNEEALLINSVTVSELRKYIGREGDNYVMKIGGQNKLGQNLGDILKNAPGMTINEQSISLIGKGVKFEINGKPINYSDQQIQAFLKNKSHKTIDKIEIILDPSSKYASDFDGRVINIITTDIDDGYLVSSYIDATRRSVFYSSSAGIDLSMQKGKFSLLTSVGYDYSKTRERRKYQQNIIFPLLDLTDQSTMDNLYVGPQYTILADYKVSKNYTIGLKLVGYNSDTNTDLDGNSKGLSDGINDFTSYLKDSLRQDNNFNNLNLNQKINFGSGNVNIDVDWGKQKLSGVSGQSLDFYDLNNVYLSRRTIGQNIDNDNEFKALKIDYGQPIGNSTLNIGFGYNATNTVQDINEKSPFVPNNSLVDAIEYNESILGTYQELTTRIYKFDVVLANRYEYTKYDGSIRSNGYAIDSTYGNFFPRAKLSLDVKDHYFSVGVRKSVRRPRFTDFIPFKRYTGSFSYYTGNPGLLAYFPKELSFNYSYRNQLWFNFTYQKASNIVSEYERLVNNIREGLKVNNGTTQSFSYSTGYGSNLASWLNLNMSFSYINGKRTLALFDENLKFAYNAYTIGFYSNMQLSKLKVSPNFYYSSDIYNSVAKNLSYWYFNVNFSYPIIQDVSEISLAVNDLFLKGITRSESDYGDINLKSSNNWDSRKVTLTFYYSFGKMDVKGPRSRSGTANQNTINRI